MTTLFKRKWRVTVDSVQSEDLDITFKIKRTLRPVAGTCELEIYGLSSTNRDTMHSAGTTAVVRVEAAYGTDALTMLFQGNMRRADTRREDSGEWITKVTAGDGEHAFRTARAGRAFGPDTSLEDVVNYLAEAMGVGVGNTHDALSNATLDRLGQTFPEGTLVRGLAARELIGLLRSANLEFSIQEGALQVITRGASLQREAILLSSDTGLLGVPQKGAHKVVTATALIIPDLVPGRLVQIQSKLVNGVYRIEDCEWTGDTRGKDWQVEMKCKEHQTQ